MRTALLAVVAMLAFCPTAFCQATAISLEELTDSSDLIIVAKVQSVSGGVLSARTARATVLETWKGSSGPVVWFVASPTSTRDVSDAVAGETAILFLVANPAGSGYAIAHSGRGRMPLRAKANARYVALGGNLTLPATLPVIDRFMPGGSEYLVDESALREFVKGVALSSTNHEVAAWAGEQANADAEFAVFLRNEGLAGDFFDEPSLAQSMIPSVVIAGLIGVAFVARVLRTARAKRALRVPL
jgi:hypothetical protein